MNMFAKFDEIPAMTPQDIKETKRYGPTHGWTDNLKTVYPPQTKFAGGIMTTYYLVNYLGYCDCFCLFIFCLLCYLDLN